MRQIPVWAVSLLVLLTACTSAGVAEKAGAERPAGQGSVEVIVEGVESAKGTVYASIYLTEEGFPEEKELAYDYRYVAAESGTLRFYFESVPAGWFVVAVLHDTDANEELSLNLLGIPKEDYGFSLNPDSTWGPPLFDEAAVFLKADEAKTVVIKF